jgi:hypothetical protein
MSFQGGYAVEGRRARSGGVGLAWLALVSLVAFTAATAQQRSRRVEPAGIPVRFTEGSVHGFLELRTADGALLAPGDLIQVVRDAGIESRMVFHFPDSSDFEEMVAYSQRGTFAMQAYHLIQRGPAFATDLDATLSRSGAYVVKTRSHRDGKEQRYTGSLDLPPDVSNGMVITIAKNLAAHDTQTVHIVAFTPQPRLIGLQLVPSASERVVFGPRAATAVNFALKPRLGALLGLFARLLGKLPPDSHLWIVGGDAPAFMRFEGPMYSGPVWRIDLATPGRPR